MTYTQIYNLIYAQLKQESITHEDAHRASIKITESIWDLYINYPYTPSLIIDTTEKEI